MIFFGQQGEDIFIFNHFLNVYNESGIFVELGGMDGVTYSNTKVFEDYFGYKGVLIEPTIQYQNMIRYRPQCKNFHVAVGLEVGHVKMKGTYATAGMVDTMHPDFADRHHPISEEYEVPALPFHDILKMADIPYIDLLSIDVEGGELIVLKTMNFNIPVYVIVIELDGYNSEKDEACRTILKEEGFSFFKRFTNNEFWVNESYFRKQLLYDSNIPKIQSLNCIDHQFPCLENGVRQEVENILQTS